MIKIIQDQEKNINTKNLQRGIFKEVVILSENDLKFNDILCGVSCDVIIVPRQITEEEREWLNYSISDGINITGKILILK